MIREIKYQSLEGATRQVIILVDRDLNLPVVGNHQLVRIFICHPKYKQIFQQLFLNQIIHKIILVELMHSNLKSKHEKSVQKPESTFAQMMVSQLSIIHKKLLSSVNAQHKRTKKPQMKYFTKIIKNIVGIASLISMDFMLTKGSKNYAKN